MTEFSAVWAYTPKSAWPEQIEAATTVLSPSPHTNLLAIEAPADGEGNYSAEEIRYVLSTAYAGFSAICDESIATLKSGSVSLNTGFWGCGAYGGNRVLMVLLQMIAAQLAGIDRLVFFLGGSDGQESFDMALEIHSDLSRSGDLRVDDLINLMEQLNFSWGYIDGN